MLFDDYNKKNSDVAQENPAGINGGSVTAQPAYDSLLGGIAAGKERIGNAVKEWGKPVSPKESEERFKSSFTEYMMPSDTPDRRKRVYALSQQSLDDVVGEYYNNRIKPLFERYKSESHNRGRDEYLKNVSVVGGSPVMAQRAAMNADDPMKVVDRAMAEIDNDELRKIVSPLAMYGGYDTDEYIEKLVKPALRDRMVSEYIKENIPKSSAEYIMRSSLNNSLVGKIASLGSGLSGNANLELDRMGLASYDANRMENLIAGIGSLIVDMPVFSALGLGSAAVVGRSTSFFANRLANKVLTHSIGNSMSKRFAQNVANRVITNKLSTKILQSSFTQGLTLGGYDVANSVADDIIYDDKVNAGKTAGAFAKGFLTGGALGAVGTPLRVASKGLKGGKKLLSSAGVLSAESAVFTLSNEADKLAHGIEVEPIDLLYDFGESTATLLAMKLGHWRPKGVAAKLNGKGHIKKEFQLSNSEKQELKELNMNPEEFMNMLEKELRLPSLGGSERLKKEYSSLMSNNDLSASLRSKLMYLVENRLTSTPPVTFDFDVDRKENGEWRVTTYDYKGNKIEQRDFPHAGNAKSYLLVERGNIRKNRIVTFESELTDGLNSQNFLRQAGLFAQENNIPVEEIAETMRKKAEKQQLTEKENAIIKEILNRSKLDDTGMEFYLEKMRREIEKKHGLKNGMLLSSVDLPFYRCSENVNRALDEYESFVRGEVEHLKKGYQVSVPDAYIGNSVRNGKTELFVNREEKPFDHEKELENHYYNEDGVKFYDNDWDYLNMAVDVPDSSNSKYVWSKNGEKNTKEDIARYKKRVEELSKKFNYNVKVITDEREITLPFEEAKNDEELREMQAYYGKMLRALGWKIDDLVCINLPNIPNMEHLERTFLHELVCHHGFDKIFGYHLRDFLEEVYRRADGTVRAGIEKMEVTYRGEERYKIVEEYLAKLVEKTAPTLHERALLTRFKEWVRKMLLKLKIYTGKNTRISQEELEMLIRQHMRYRIRNAPFESFRKDVYGMFKSSRYPMEEYTNDKAYLKSVRDKIVNDEYLKFVPDYLHEAKKRYSNAVLPESMRKDYMDGVDIGGVKELPPNDYYRFIGERGADNLARHEGFEGDYDFASALKKSALGNDNSDIKYDTGWERGIDKQWRKEISDNRLRVVDYVEKILADNNSYLSRKYNELKKKPLEEWGDEDYKAWNTVFEYGKDYFEDATLKDIVKDPTFFLSYPELSDIPVEIQKDAPVPLRYDSRNKKVIVDGALFMDSNAGIPMSGLLQQLIQDYEGFSRAVSLNYYGINSRIAKQYKEAMRIISRFEEMKSGNPDSELDGKIEQSFRKMFGMSINEFKKKFPSLDEYMIYRLTGRNFSFSGDVEVRNVMRRNNFHDFQGHMIPAEVTEDMPRDQQKIILDISDIRKYFSGPLDILTDYIEEVNSKYPMRYDGKPGKRYNRSLHYVEPTLFDKVYKDYEPVLLEEKRKRSMEPVKKLVPKSQTNKRLLEEMEKYYGKKGLLNMGNSQSEAE